MFFKISLDKVNNIYNNYLVVFKTVEGNEVYSQTGLEAQKKEWGQTLNLNLPVTALSTDDYILTLSGITAAGKTEVLHRYFFSAIRK